MIAIDAISVGAEAIDDIKTYLRVGIHEEDALIARLAATAIGHGERFIRQMMLVRPVRETLRAGAAWTRLSAMPVTAIAGVEAVPATGDPVALAVDAHAIDIDAAGTGWLRLTTPGAGMRVRVRYDAGIAPDWAGLPDPLRQGVVRLASHLYTHRDSADEGAPPSAVVALWRPWRRMVLA